MLEYIIIMGAVLALIIAFVGAIAPGTLTTAACTSTDTGGAFTKAVRCLWQKTSGSITGAGSGIANIPTK